MTVTAQESKDILVYSNLSYLLPAVTTLYKLSQDDFNGYDASGMTVLFLYVGLISSWSYHSCRADLTIASNTNTNAILASTTNIPACTECPNDTPLTVTKEFPGAQQPINFGLAKFIDQFTAILTLIVVIIQVIPLHNSLRKFVMLISVLWLLFFLSSGNEGAALVPALLALLLLFVFWFMSWNANRISRNVSWIIAFVLLVAAVWVFKVQDEPYYLHHSLWHIFSALSSTFLILQTANCYKNIDLDKVTFPRFMENLFVPPYECS